MAKKRTAEQEAFFAQVEAKQTEKATEEAMKKVDNFYEPSERDTKILSLYPQFNVNQIASMLMIPKAIVEQVLADNE